MNGDGEPNTHNKRLKLGCFFCKTDYDECTSGPCLNGGTCVNGKTKFTCVCPRTHMGQICEGGFGLAIISAHNCNNSIKLFKSRGQQPCKFIGTKESV